LCNLNCTLSVQDVVNTYSPPLSEEDNSLETNTEFPKVIH